MRHCHHGFGRGDDGREASRRPVRGRGRGRVRDRGRPAEQAFRDRIDEIQDAVTAWSGAATLTEAHAAAEIAANLVAGPNGPDFGDRDGDGAVGGDTTVGLLPGIDGTPTGIAVSLAGQDDPLVGPETDSTDPARSCVTRDVLGSGAADPAAGWDDLEAAIEAWLPDDNTMPTLDSHPMRIVGWATFTLGSDSLDDAHEYGGHAQLHTDVARRALGC